VNADQVLDTLRAKHFRKSGFAFLREVRSDDSAVNGTRYADGLAVSLRRSLGSWFAGVEVKTNRGDWKSERRHPEKAGEVQRFCRYWWIASTPDVVNDGEVLGPWGHMVVSGGVVRIAKEAPLLSPEPPTAGFVASVLRCFAKDRAEISAAWRRGYDEARSNDPWTAGVTHADIVGISVKTGLSTTTVRGYYRRYGDVTDANRGLIERACVLLGLPARGEKAGQGGKHGNG
jgi:hypothetical protein